MRLAIMQPYLFPYLGYFQLLASVDRFVCYDDVAFIKQGWINRNRVLVNGEPVFITVPVRDRSSFRKIRDVEIDPAPGAPWRRKLLKTVDNAYRRAPQFNSVFPLVESVLTAPASRVSDLAVASITGVARRLGLPAHIVPSSTVYGNEDLRAQQRVLAICRAEGATEYINPYDGREMYARDAFAEAGVGLRFLRPGLPEYQQFGTPFVPALSIIDVLMFNPVEAVREQLRSCELV